MLKFIFAGRRASGTSRTAALRHLRDVHGPMVVCPPADAGLMPRDYVQNHVIDGTYRGTGEHAIERDLVTELWFDSVEEMRAAVETPYYLTNVRPDEPRFVDDGTVAKMRVEPCVRRDGKEGRYKLFFFLSRGPGEDQHFNCERDDLAARIKNLPGVVRVVENIVQDGPNGRAPFVDLVFEAWFMTADDAVRGLAITDALIDLRSDGFSAARSFAVAAEEFDRARLIDLHHSKRAMAGAGVVT